MGTIGYACGCSVSWSLFGEREILGVTHCWQHQHLYRQDKTNRQMAEEIRRAEDHTWRPWPMPDYGEVPHA